MYGIFPSLAFHIQVQSAHGNIYRSLLKFFSFLGFLDLQLADAREQVEIAEQALLGAGVSEENVKSGGKQLEKAVPDNSMGLLFALMGAQTYLKFVLRYRNYKNIVNFQNAAKPMLAIDVSELDKDPNLLNTPYATFDLEKGMAGELPHNPEDLITKITNCSPGDKGEQIWSVSWNYKAS